MKRIDHLPKHRSVDRCSREAPTVRKQPLRQKNVPVPAAGEAPNTLNTTSFFFHFQLLVPLRQVIQEISALDAVVGFWLIVFISADSPAPSNSCDIA